MVSVAYHQLFFSLKQGQAKVRSLFMLNFLQLCLIISVTLFSKHPPNNCKKLINSEIFLYLNYILHFIFIII